MAHTFLLESGSWLIKGIWSPKNKPPIVFNGATIITWEDDSWFFIKTKMVFPEDNRPEINFEYKGCLPSHKTQYAYILKRSDHNSIEGEGWITTDSIIQSYWVLNEQKKLHGVEQFFYLDDDTYHLTNVMMTGNSILYTFAGTLERHG